MPIRSFLVCEHALVSALLDGCNAPAPRALQEIDLIARVARANQRVWISKKLRDLTLARRTMVWNCGGAPGPESSRAGLRISVSSPIRPARQHNAGSPGERSVAADEPDRDSDVGGYDTAQGTDRGTPPAPSPRADGRAGAPYGRGGGGAGQAVPGR